MIPVSLPIRVLLIIAVFTIVSCKEETPAPPPVPKPAPAPAPKPEVKKPDTLRFDVVAIKGFSSLKELDDKLGPEKMFLLLKVNRLDRAHIRDNDTLVVPTAFDERLSPYPAKFEGAREIPKLLIISRRAQVFAAYDSGTLVRWGPTSTGKKKTPTPDGLYAANWKKDTAISTVNPSWILPWCVNIHNLDGISLHQFDLPGYPASHSCIRLLGEDARWIFDWVYTWRLTKDAREIRAHGTPVIIFDEYSYGRPFIRKQIIKNPAAHFVAPASLDSVLTIHKPEIMSRQTERMRIMQEDSSKVLAKPL